MKRYFILVFLLIVSIGAVGVNPNLNRLDDVIRNRHSYEVEKREGIAKALTDYEKSHDDESRYNALRGLYESYRSYRVDSALIVAHKRLDIARRLGIPSKIASASINLAEGYTRSGSVDLAINILDTLHPSFLENHHIKYRNAVYREAYRSKAYNSVLQEEKDAAFSRLKALNDSALNESPETSRGYYTLTAEKLCDAGLYRQAIATVKEAEKQYDFSNDPAMLATIGNIYLQAGDIDKAIDYLSSSAILDITSGTKEYSSLITLTNILLNQGDIKRAFEYINCAFEDAEFSHANLRTAEIMKIMPVIDKTFHNKEKETSRLTLFFLIAAGIMVIALLILVAWYVKALRAKRKMMATIREINNSLEERNKALAEADALKLHYINLLMKANSEYISRLKAFRKNVYRSLKTNRIDNALDLVKSTREEANDIAAFQELFDQAFLSIFPDFIETMNGFMKEPIELKEPLRLTPELRVMALMKLHMDSTEEISALLHYSNQTVYNLRTTIRGMLNIPWEEFERRLKES